MWFWAEGTQLNVNELRYKLLLSIDSTGSMMWHRAANKGRLQSSDSLWNCVKETELNTDEFLQAETGDEYTVFQLAAGNNRLRTVHAVFVWAEISKPNSREDNIKMDIKEIVCEGKY